MAMDSLDTITDNIINHLQDPSLIPGCPAFDASTYCFSRRLVKAIAKEIIKVQIETKAEVGPDTGGFSNPAGSIS